MLEGLVSEVFEMRESLMLDCPCAFEIVHSFAAFFRWYGIWNTGFSKLGWISNCFGGVIGWNRDITLGVRLFTLTKRIYVEVGCPLILQLFSARTYLLGN